MRVKRFVFIGISLSVILALSLAVSLTGSRTAFADESNPEVVGPYLASDLPSKGIGFIFDDARDPRMEAASFLGDTDRFYPNQNGIFDLQSSLTGYCNAVDDAVCSKAKKLEAVAIMPPCLSPSDNYCIESVYAIIDDKKISGSYIESVPTKLEHTFTGDSKLNLASGGTASVWKIPGVMNGAGNENYVVKTYLRQKSVRNSDGTVQPFSVNMMSLGFFATNPVTGNFPPPQANNGGGDGFVKFGCSTNSDTLCERRTSFAPGARYGIVLRFAKAPVSWFYGRLGKAFIDSKPESYGISMTVEGEPVLVPVVAGFSPWNQLPPYLQSRYQQGDGFGYDGNKNGETDPTKWQFRALHTADDFAALKAWLPLLSDKATIMTPQFFLNSVPENAMGNLLSCFTKGGQVNGLVTSNATAYTPGPPNFNQQDQSLDYQISAPHYTAGGNLMKGTYDLSIRAEVARCIYGFSSAPIKASISVVSENGVASVATENVGEKDGWFRLGAYGFTFSQPKLRVKLTQERAPESAPVNNGKPATSPGTTPMSAPMTTPKAANKPPKSVTIKCVKGKSVKMVTSSYPSCPPGFKKV